MEETSVVADAVAAVAQTQTDLGTVGGAIILCAVAVMAFRWIKASFF